VSAIAVGYLHVNRLYATAEKEMGVHGEVWADAQEFAATRPRHVQLTPVGSYVVYITEQDRESK